MEFAVFTAALVADVILFSLTGVFWIGLVVLVLLFAIGLRAIWEAGWEAGREASA